MCLQLTLPKGPDILDFLSISIDPQVLPLANKALCINIKTAETRSLPCIDLDETACRGAQDPSSERDRGHRGTIEQAMGKWATRRLDA